MLVKSMGQQWNEFRPTRGILLPGLQGVYVGRNLFRQLATIERCVGMNYDLQGGFCCPDYREYM